MTVVAGTVPERVPVREGRVDYEVDLRGGQKTGLFLDQRENREAALRYAHGRLLDAFSYDGGFALALAPACTGVVALEISADASARIHANAARNGIRGIDVRTVNVFDELHELDRRDERFDTIVLDPPAFAKNKASVPKALTGYKEINRRALRLLDAGRHPGHLHLLAPRRRRAVRGRRARRRGGRRRRRVDRREADPGPRPPGTAGRS